jgi:hypothetical protein
MAPAPGEVWLWNDFYVADDGRACPKYAVVLAITRGGDIVLRLLTSRSNLRPIECKCSHDHPPGYHLGVLDPEGRLHAESWVDLRDLDDIDPSVWRSLVASGKLSRQLCLDAQLLCNALACAAEAPDTTRHQRAAMYETRAQLRCC